MVAWYIYLHENLKNKRTHIGKYISPMDGMGYMYIPMNEPQPGFHKLTMRNALLLAVALKHVKVFLKSSTLKSAEIWDGGEVSGE